MLNTVKNKIIVSDRFYNIYKEFNFKCQLQEMKLLSKKELYLLLTVCIDKFEECQIVSNNLKEFKPELKEIFDIQDDKPVVNEILIELISETGDYIDTDVIIDSQGNKLPEPLSKEELRDLKISYLG